MIVDIKKKKLEDQHPKQPHKKKKTKQKNKKQHNI